MTAEDEKPPDCDEKHFSWELKVLRCTDAYTSTFVIQW